MRFSCYNVEIISKSYNFFSILTRLFENISVDFWKKCLAGVKLKSHTKRKNQFFLEIKALFCGLAQLTGKSSKTDGEFHELNVIWIQNLERENGVFGPSMVQVPNTGFWNVWISARIYYFKFQWSIDYWSVIVDKFNHDFQTFFWTVSFEKHSLFSSSPLTSSSNILRQLCDTNCGFCCIK